MVGFADQLARILSSQSGKGGRRGSGRKSPSLKKACWHCRRRWRPFFARSGQERNRSSRNYIFSSFFSFFSSGIELHDLTGKWTELSSAAIQVYHHTRTYLRTSPTCTRTSSTFKDISGQNGQTDRQTDRSTYSIGCTGTSIIRGKRKALPRFALLLY